MAGKRFSAEQIIMKLREAEVGLAQGQRVGQVSKQMGVPKSTATGTSWGSKLERLAFSRKNSYYRWRKEYGGLRLDQAKRLKVLEKENTRADASLKINAPNLILIISKAQSLEGNSDFRLPTRFGDLGLDMPNAMGLSPIVSDL